MKTLILDGSRANDRQAVNITNALHKHLPNAETITVREQKIGNCAGDFFCWVRNPGICNTNDDNRIIAEKIINSDLVIYLTPVTFGGYSSELKRMVDHQIQNILPFFAKVNGEVHHQKRYKQYPNMLTIGWMEEPDKQAEAIFRHLVHRNAINMYAKTSVCGLVIGRQPEAELTSQTKLWLEAIASGSNSPAPALPSIDISTSEINSHPTRSITRRQSTYKEKHISIAWRLSLRTVECTWCGDTDHSNLHNSQFTGTHECNV